MTKKVIKHFKEAELQEKQISTKEVYRGNFIRVEEDRCILPNGREASREVVRHPGAVAVLAVVDGKIILVEQYRYPIARATWEIPAGKIDPGEEPAVCAERELEEETGLRAKKMRYLFSYYTTPGFSDEIMHFFYAEDLYAGLENPDEDEFLNLMTLPCEQALAAIGKEKICDSKTIMALLWYQSNISK